MENTEPGKDCQLKPNLRRAGQSATPKKFILAACLMAAIWMYPTILKPMFGGGESMSPKDEKQLEADKAELRKHRPSFMPDWTSPFGPKEEK